ncbi:hypothetical protein BYT27DRAFT_7127504 [Phlegmacium glaucopus]|nr:hypothetical protein BYT27DRAFT_7127504 [Phlegmacium glaucopus]
MFVSKPLPTTQKMRGKATRFRILVVGRANSGKTTILRRLCNTTGEPMIFSPNGEKRTVNSTESAQLENYKGGQALVSARNVLITSSNLVTVRNGGFHNHNHVHVAYDNRNDIWDKLRTMVAFGALHDSAARHNPPKCHPNTRRAVLKQIMEWVNNLEKIIWLYGSAGTGKTTLAQSITELCHEMNILAASFSFSTTVEGCSDSTRLIVTIAYQLCLSIPEVRCYIEAVVERDPNILQWSLDAQIQKFIIWPLSQIKSQLTSPQAVNSRPNLIVIDGLDECGNEDMQCCVLRALSAVFKSHEFPICFLITSRPEQHIREFFQAGPLRSMTKFLPLDNTYSDDDIQAFLRSNFDDIKREHPLKSHIPVSWPPETVIKRLVQQSSGQFIYASAVTKYMKSPQHQPTERLNHIFGITDGGSDNPFAELDVLYNRIFSLVDDIHTVLDVLSILLHLKHYWFPRTVNLKLMEGLLDLERGTLHHKLVHLHSILDIPAPDDDKTEIRILHASLNDFLRDETRSRQYHIDASRAHAKLTQRFMTFIPIAHKKNYNMDDLARLSCQFFMVHCVLSYPTPELLEDLRNFDISGFLNLLSSLGLSPVTINRQISDLFAWLNQVCHFLFST